MDNVRLESQSDEHPEYKHTQHPEQKILTEPDLQFRENVWEIGKQKVNGFPPNREKRFFSVFRRCWAGVLSVLQRRILRRQRTHVCRLQRRPGSVRRSQQ